MVWIHGGAFIVGTARSTWCDGTELAKRGDVVVVNLEYRLGPFGFLDLAEIGGREFAASGNAGLLDQIAALRWVHENIVTFGGDPNNVTIFGESAGGLSVEALIGSPAADGLFQKAIAQSPWLYAQPSARADAIARQFMKMTSVQTIDQLQTMTVDQLMTAERELFQARFRDTAFMPMIDGVTLVDQPLVSVRDAKVHSVPMVIGSTLDEMRYWSEADELPLEKRPLDELKQQLNSISNANPSRLIDTYIKNSQNPGEGILALLTDAIFRIPISRFAEANTPYKPTWLYLFTYRSTAQGKQYGAAHAMDLPFVFGSLDRLDIIAFTGADSHRAQLMNQIQAAWVNFARNGDPNDSNLPVWPKYNIENRLTMLLGISSGAVQDPYSAERKSWTSIAFDGTNPSLDQLSDLVAPVRKEK